MESFTPPKVSGEPGSAEQRMQYEELSDEDRLGLIDFFNGQTDFFNAHLGFKLIEAKKGYAKLEVENTSKLCQPAMIMHGGASFGLADAAMAMALVAIYGRGHMLLTIEMKINYLEPIPLGLVAAEAHILRASRRSAYGEVDIWAAGKLAARVTSTYMIRPFPGSPRPS